MRIAFISTVLGYPWGGADTLWTRAAEAARERGDVLLISVSSALAAHPRIAALIGSGAETVIREQPPARLSIGSRALRKLGLARSDDANLIAKLRSFRPDCVIFSQGGTYDLILQPQLMAWLRSSGTKYRIVANWQQERPQLSDTHLAFIRDTFFAADHVYFVSTRNLAVTRRHLAVPLPNAAVIQNPLRWEPADAAPWPDGTVTRLATVSRLDEGKGIQLLLEALSIAGPSLPDWQLNIFGSGPYETQLRQAVTRLGLSERVQFRGYVTGLRAIWGTNQLLVSPALEDGVPMTIPEAMLCQRPVLATCVGGAEDWITPQRTGFLCPEPSVPELTAALRQAFAVREKWAAMGRAAAESVARHYRADDYLKLIA